MQYLTRIQVFLQETGPDLQFNAGNSPSAASCTAIFSRFHKNRISTRHRPLSAALWCVPGLSWSSLSSSNKQLETDFSSGPGPTSRNIDGEPTFLLETQRLTSPPNYQVPGSGPNVFNCGEQIVVMLPHFLSFANENEKLKCMIIRLCVWTHGAKTNFPSTYCRGCRVSGIFVKQW